MSDTTNPSPDFDDAFEAFIDGDIDRLEALAEGTRFPHGRDGWLGRYWLTTAIHSSNPDAVAWVLSKSVDVNYKDDEGYTPLRSALEMEDNPAFARGASGEIELVNCGGTERTICLIDLLLAAGADIDQGGTLGETALHKAAMISSPAVVAHLLECGADPTLWDDEYEPQQPAHYAEFFKRWEVHDILVEAMRQAGEVP